ncbi:MAG: hypothetical protein M1821_003180 [Bathelium mastoideum]|nr:MAG: hypothetical protein M1821_003180 [Bathelium mastoideum]
MALSEDEKVVSSEEDDIQTDTTESSSKGSDYEYTVEAILAEGPSEDGTMLYLVKWEGYPLFRATWEPEQMFTTPALLETWRETKANIAKGLQEAFELEDYKQSIEEENRRLENRSSRRRKKRLAREVSTTLEATEDGRTQTMALPSQDSELSLFVPEKTPEKSTAQIEASDSQPSEVPEDELTPEVETDPPRIIGRRELIVLSSDSEDEPRIPPEEIPKEDDQSLDLEEPRPNSVVHQKNIGESVSIGGLATETKRPVASTGTRKAVDVLNNWDRPGKRRAFYGRVERIPNPENLTFIDLQKVKPPQSSHALDTAKEITPVNTAPETTDSARKSSLDTGPIHQGEFSRSPVVVPVYSKATASSVSKSAEEASPKWTGKPPMTCRRWKLDNSCPYSDADCPLQHRSLELLEPPSGPPPKFWRNPQTCCFWYTRNACQYTPDQCKFAHWNTGLLANPSDLKNPTKISEASIGQTAYTGKIMKTCWYWKHSTCAKPDGQCKFAHVQCEEDSVLPFLNPPDSGRSVTKAGIADFQPPYEPLIMKTCWYWKTGSCAKPDAQCKYAHFQCEEDAGPPGSYKESLNLQVPRTVSELPGNESTRIPQQAIAQESASQAKMVHDPVVAILGLPTAENTMKSMGVLMTGMEPGVKHAFTAQTGLHPRLNFEHMCMAEHYKHYTSSQKPVELAKGEISTDSGRSPDMDAFVRHLRLQSSAALFFHQRFTMVLYPAEDQEWNFLASVEKPIANSKLWFFIHEPVAEPLPWLGQITSLEQNSRAESPVITLFREVFGITPEGLFTWRNRKSPPQPIDRNVFLMIPACYADEIALLRKFFAACKAKVQVGAWMKVSQSYSSLHGVVLFHPTFVPYHRLVNLHKFLIRGNRWNMFEIGCMNTSFDSVDIIAEPSNNYTIRKLFPDGGIFFLTDEAISTQPLQVLAAVLKFVGFLRTEKQEHQNWHVVGRPGLVQWIRQLAKERNDADLFQIYVELEQLPSSFYSAKYAEDDLGEILPSQPALVISPDPDTLPEHAELSKTDPVAATDLMIEWYAGWLIDQREVARRFSVVVPDPKAPAARKWREKYQHFDIMATDFFVKQMWSHVHIDTTVQRRLEALWKGKNEALTKK